MGIEIALTDSRTRATSSLLITLPTIPTVALLLKEEMCDPAMLTTALSICRPEARSAFFMDNAFEVPDTPGVRIENACIVEIANSDGPYVGFNHICNGIGPGICTGTGGKGFARQILISYNNTKALTVDDYYKHGSSESGIINEEKGKQTSYDPKAEGDGDNKSKLNGIHSGIKCKGCGMKPIVGCRFKCLLCDKCLNDMIIQMTKGKKILNLRGAIILQF